MLVNNRERTTRRIVLVAGILFAGENTMSYDQPDYTALCDDRNTAYQQGEPYLVSQAAIENAGDYKDSGNGRFRRLFKFITDANQG